MHSQNFVNLRTHTNYSLSEGMLTSNYIADFCVNDKQPACAITDTSNLFGAFEFSEKLFSFLNINFRFTRISRVLKLVYGPVFGRLREIRYVVHSGPE